MPNFVLSELILLSFVEKKARRIRFHPRTTVILGANDTGKSSLLKSIYATFGAEPARIHPLWKTAEVTSLVRFSCAGQSYSMLKYGSHFAIFDAEDQLLQRFSRVSSDLAPFLAELFGFGLRLTSRSGQSTVPPPAFLFLPFYIDQDASWQHNWSGFTHLRQFSNWRQAVVQYHTGIRPNRYYDISATIGEVKSRLEANRDEYKALNAARRRVARELPHSTFDVDVTSFKDEIDELLVRCQELNRREEEYKVQLVTLEGQRLALHAQLEIVSQSLIELAADAKYATFDLTSDHVDCPTCGASYENSFAERFAIAQDEDRCRELLIQLRAEVSEVEGKLETLSSSLNEVREEAARVHSVLAERKGDIQLQDVIAAEGKKGVQQVFASSIANYMKDIRADEEKIDGLQESLKEFDNKERRKAIEGYYLDQMRAFLHMLDVRNMRESSYAHLTSQVSETGSDLPRALLAYYYSILHTMRSYSTSTFCPVVLDSPNQQGQDVDSLRTMLKFIFSKQPPDSQLILGLEDQRGVSFDGSLITLTDKFSLLAEAEYGDLCAELRVFLDQSLLSN